MADYTKEYMRESDLMRFDANWDERGASIEYPSDWLETSVKYSDEGAFLRIEKDKGIIMFNIEIGNEPIVLDDYFNWYTQDRNVTKDKIIDDGITEINGVEAFWLLIKGTELIGGDFLMDKAYFFVKGNHAYRLHLIADASEFDENEKEYNDIIRTLRFE